MQLKTSKTIRFFDESFRQKFNFEPYSSLDKPTVFFGVYRPEDLAAIKAHRGIKIVWFAGTDSTYTANLILMRDDQDFRNVVYIAESPWIEKDLAAIGLKYEAISILMSNLNNWKPTPHGTSLYWYGASNSKYGKQYYRAIKNEFPDINIIAPGDAHVYTREQMPEIYAGCFAGIRLAPHDGMSQSVAEMGLMGRYTIWNGRGPFVKNYSSIEDVIRIIKGLRAGYPYKRVSRRSHLYFYEQEGLWSRLVLRLCGIEEINSAGIFVEGRDHGGSSFRIQRTDDVKKIGGFGTEQFERPWFNEQLVGLKKRAVTTSKPSGYIASEWKNTNMNNGYPDGFKDYYTIPNNAK